MRKSILCCAVLTVLLAVSGCTMVSPADLLPGAADSVGGGANAEWDAGNIISDEVFYNATALTSPDAVQAALDQVGGDCTDSTCLRVATYTTTTASNPYCSTYYGGTSEKYAAILFKLAQACGLNPQVAIIMIQKESQGLTRSSPPAALTGVGCPDTGPGGSANCDSSVGGVWAQTYGLFVAFAKLHKDPSKVNYPEGKTSNILWNVEETGCGSAPVLVKNRATATLYTFTPYQPNAASLAAYPGEGDECSAYGNRNFFRMFQKYFGDTGGGVASAGGGTGNVTSDGSSVTIPNNEFVVAELRGKKITTPNAGVAKGIAAGMSYLGYPYTWGGGGDGAGPNDGCSRGGGDYNSCGGPMPAGCNGLMGCNSTIGFDCSGLTAYVLVSGGFPSPGGSSGEQRGAGQSVPYAQGLPGDIVGFPGHVAIFLGNIDGQPYILEASWVGTPIHIVKLTRSDRDSTLHRHWSQGASA